MDHSSYLGTTSLKLMNTPGGVRFGLLSQAPTLPAPTLFVLAGGIEDMLQVPYSDVGLALAKKGFVSVLLDLPCHGKDSREGEPKGMEGWRARAERGENFIHGFAANASRVLDYLIKEGYVDSERVAAEGTSRGGFMALQFAAAEARVKCVAAFAPVTNLLALREFSGKQEDPLVQSFSLIHQAGKLAGRPIWMTIGNNDLRVDTDEVIRFTREVVRHSAKLRPDQPAPVELQVGVSLGHTTPAGAYERAAEWIPQQLKSPQASSL